MWFTDSSVWLTSEKMNSAEVLQTWRELYKQIFPLLLKDNLTKIQPKTPEQLAQITANHVNEALKQYQIMEEKVIGMKELADVEL